MATIFPREQKAKMLFEKIKENPQACERLMETFYDALGVGDDYEGNGLSAEQFATALFRSYEEKDLTAFLMAICQNSMFDLLRNSFLAPFRFNANGQTNPYILTDEDGKLIPDIKFHVSDKNYEQFFKVFQKSEQVKMYLKIHEIRAIVDDRNEKIGRKIRDNEMKRIPYMLIVGEKEAENGEVSVRRQGEGDKGTMKFEEFAKILNEEVQNMINKW